MHPGSWAAWLALVMAVALAASNPFYLVIVLLTVLLVAVFAPRTGMPMLGFGSVLVFGLGVFALSFFVAIINGSYGEHILFTLPGPDLPDWLGGLTIGGPVSAEGLVAAGIKGLGILCVLLAFAAFNTSITPQRMLRTAPAALFHAGLVVTIGMALLPASIADVQRIRETRALRGAPSGLRAAPALVVPALLGGLERAMQTAEAMEARGYAAADPLPARAQLLFVAAPALLVLSAWLWFFYPGWKVAGAGAAILGVACLVVAAVLANRARHTTRLFREPYPWFERAVAVVSALSGLAIVITGAPGLDYNPFAGLEMPPFDPRGAFIAICCAWPAAFFLARVPEPPPAQPMLVEEPS